MLASILASVAPDQRYADSVTAITGYASTIAGLSPPAGLPSDPACTQATTALSQAQTTALKWFNSVYPSALEVPQAVVDQSAGITASLEALSTAAGQLAGDPSNTKLQTALAGSATALSGRVQPLQQQSATLASSLSGFLTDQQTADADLQTAGGGLQGLLSQLNAQVGNDIGQYDSLQNAPCPNQGDIQAAQQQIATDQHSFSVVGQFSEQLQQAGQGSSAARAGLQYLAGTWSQLADTGGTIVKQLAAVATDPATVVQLDLSAAQTGWSNLNDHIAAITTRTRAAVTRT
jgi:hypothetical protein